MKKKQWEKFLKTLRSSLQQRGVLTGPCGALAQALCHAADSTVTDKGGTGPPPHGQSRPLTRVVVTTPGRGASRVFCWWRLLAAWPLWLVLPQKVRFRQEHLQETHARPQERHGGRAGSPPPESTQAPGHLRGLLFDCGITHGPHLRGTSSAGPQGTMATLT